MRVSLAEMTGKRCSGVEASLERWSTLRQLCLLCGFAAFLDVRRVL